MSEQQENKALTEKPQKQLTRRPATESAWIYRVLRVLAAFLFHTFVPVRYHHIERAQLDAPFIVIGNHLSLLDPVIVAAAVKRYEIAFMAKKELSGNGLFKRFLLCIHTIFVSRHNSDMEAMRACMKALRGGDILGIFPEGTRHHEGVMTEMETGVAMIALRAGVPVIPVLVPRLRWFHRVDCFVGEEIPTADLREQGVNTQTCQALLTRITACYEALMAQAGAKSAES